MLFFKAGNNSAASTARIAMTTINSINVNPLLPGRVEVGITDAISAKLKLGIQGDQATKCAVYGQNAHYIPQHSE
jgi:hypothetical protein